MRDVLLNSAGFDPDRASRGIEADTLAPMSRSNSGSVAAFEPVVDPQPDHGTHAATIVDIDGDGHPMIDVGGTLLAARTTVPLDRSDVGREVTFCYLGGDRSRPVITGVLEDAAPARTRKLKFRAKDIDLAAADEITLTCGKASITLRRDGKIVIKGVHILSHASGVSRIRGGTIELN